MTISDENKCTHSEKVIFWFAYGSIIWSSFSILRGEKSTDTYYSASSVKPIIPIRSLNYCSSRTPSLSVSALLN